MFEVGALMHAPAMFPAMLYPPPPPPPPQVQKRPSSEVEDPPSQKSKKAKKSKAADGNGACCCNMTIIFSLSYCSILQTWLQRQEKKRGSTDRCSKWLVLIRQVTTHVHPHSAQLMPTVSYTSTPADKGKEKPDEGPFIRHLCVTTNFTLGRERSTRK